MGFYSWSIVSLAYGSKWRRGRRLFHELFNIKAVANFDDYQRKYTNRFLSHLAETPEKFLDHVKLCVSLQIGFSWHSPKADLSLF